MDEQHSAVIDPRLFDAGSVAIIQWSVSTQAHYWGPVSYISNNMLLSCWAMMFSC